LIYVIQINKGYHQSNKPDEKYILYGDVDVVKNTGEHTDFDTWSKAFTKFLKEEYKLEEFTIVHTENKEREGSFHWSIPKYQCSAIKLKVLVENFREKNGDLSKFMIQVGFVMGYGECLFKRFLATMEF
jgi:hypothetical protein